jgi:hypothetical protein
VSETAGSCTQFQIGVGASRDGLMDRSCVTKGRRGATVTQVGGRDARPLIVNANGQSPWSEQIP